MTNATNKPLPVFGFEPASLSMIKSHHVLIEIVNVMEVTIICCARTSSHTLVFQLYITISIYPDRSIENCMQSLPINYNNNNYKASTFLTCLGSEF